MINSNGNKKVSFTPTLKAILEEQAGRQGLPQHFVTAIAERWYLPLAAHMAALHAARGTRLLISFNGSQGSGKSTITAFLTLILKHQFNLNSVELSIDDFYLTHQQRQQLAQDVHPLFATRGVPGTHDIDLAQSTIDCLGSASESSPCLLPRFSKADDDRLPSSTWPQITQPVDIILFEGWCNHAPPQEAQQLVQPINALEKDEDPDGIWRSYANDQLKLYHQRLFRHADLLIFLQIPSFEMVYEWRGLQEKKLAATEAGSGKAIMDEAALQRFIQHYERITRAGLAQLPSQADIVLTLNATHGIDDLKIKNRM